MGGTEKTAEFARGCSSCRASITASATRAPRPPSPRPRSYHWVEEGKAPERQLGEAEDANGKVLRTRPLFPYPQFAKYSGTGDPNDAANFIAVSNSR